MKNIIKMIILLTLSLESGHASTASLSLCYDQAKNYGNGHGADHINKDCLSLFSSNANGHNIAYSPSGKIKATAFRNIVIVEKILADNKIRTDFIAGNSTGLAEIKAIAIDEDHEEIIILNGDNSVLFFSFVITGNISPYRILRSAALENSFDIEYIVSSSQVAIASGKTGQVLLFSRKANIHAPKERRFLDIEKSFEKKFNGHFSITYNKNNDKIYILDSEVKNVSEVDVAKVSEFKTTISPSSLKISSPNFIRYSYKANKLIIQNEKKETFSP